MVTSSVLETPCRSLFGVSMGEPGGLVLCVTGITHTGKVRLENQDTIAAGRWVRNEPMTRPERLEFPLTRPVVCLVADGMGGHAAGEVASFHAASRLVQSADRLTDERAAAEQLQRLSDELVELTKADSTVRGMGTTVAGLVAGPAGLLHFNVGDSRVYRDQNGFLRQLSVDDSNEPRNGPADAGESRSNSHVITQALGGASHALEIAPHVRSDALPIASRYLICSDGLTTMLGLDEMEACLVADDEETAVRLLEQALERGGTDNISILIVRIREPETNETTVAHV